MKDNNLKCSYEELVVSDVVVSDVDTELFDVLFSTIFGFGGRPFGRGAVVCADFDFGSFFGLSKSLSEELSGEKILFFLD